MGKYRKTLGMRLMTFAPGAVMTREFAAFAREYGLVNFILFSRDIVSLGQTRALCAALDEISYENCGHVALIATDQEGGRVQRLPKSYIDAPSMGELASSGDEGAAERAGYDNAKALRSFGMNFDLAPVMDINYGAENPVVGDRSFGGTKEAVSRYGAAFIRGLSRGGACSCAKHFPGHGGTDIDTHLKLATLPLTREELLQGAAVPFKAAIDAGVDAIMTTHILFPNIDPHFPATMSREIISGILRRDMGYCGLVMTDCLEMLAIVDNYTTGRGALMAVKAGVDMPLISHTRERVMDAVALMEDAYESGGIDPAEHERSIGRILALHK